jgi:adenosylhomocysteine nucleosidase
MINQPHLTLICFAVPDEAGPFLKVTRGKSGITTIITGMGPGNARRQLDQFFANSRPGRVITAGFAGGLNPALPAGCVLFDADGGTGLAAPLEAAGALRGTFHCAEKVAITAAEKSALRSATRADAVEMESGVIRALCQSHGVPSATVRVILDRATEDLPLDFNRLTGPDGNVRPMAVLVEVLKKPWLVGRLLRLGRASHACAQRLAAVLASCNSGA